MTDNYSDRGTLTQMPCALLFVRDSLREKSWPYLAWLVLAGMAAVVIYYLTRSAPIASVRPALLLYYTIAIVHVIFRLKGRHGPSILSPDILFLLAYSFFHIGYMWLYDLGIVPYTDPPFIFEESIPKTMFIVNLGLVSFLFGYEVLGSRRGSDSTVRITPPRIGWGICGIAFMVLAIIAHLRVMFKIGFSVFYAHGYEAFANIEKYTGSKLFLVLWVHSVTMIVIGVVIYVISSALRYGKIFHSKVALALVIIFLTFLFLEGDRGPMVIILTPILLVRHYVIKPIRIRYLLLLFVGFMALFTAIRAMRTVVYAPARMAEEFKYQKSAGELNWKVPFIETGSSLGVLNITSHEVPSAEPYWKGESWKTAIIRIVPFLEGFTVSQGWSIWGPAEWVTTTYYGSERAGRGFLITAEGYLNFGYIGVIIELVFFGMFLRWLSIKFGKNPSAMWGMILLGCVGLSIGVVRAQLSGFLAPCARIMLVAWLLNLFFSNETSSYGLEPEEDMTALTDENLAYD